MKSGALKVMVFIAAAAFLWGCATGPIVQPTQEEMEAVRKVKKTVAIIEINEDSSKIKGIKDAAFSKLENILTGHFNLVEREKIESLMRERNLDELDEVERYAELGGLLGADYLFYGKATAFFSAPVLKNRKRTKKDGKFTGSIWKESKAICRLNIKIIEVSSGLVYYSDTKEGSKNQKEDKRKYTNEDTFNSDLAMKSKLNLIVNIADSLIGLKKENSAAVTKAMEKATKKFKKDIKSKFTQSGEIMQIISEKEVMVNLGSAYGLRPGDKLEVWEELSAIKDPKTGVVTVPRRKKATLKITKITSGLSCIAKGKAKDIADLMVGEKVTTR